MATTKEKLSSGLFYLVPFNAHGVKGEMRTPQERSLGAIPQGKQPAGSFSLVPATAFLQCSSYKAPSHLFPRLSDREACKDLCSTILKAS